MTSPAQWAELVTTALLGTDRRPLDAIDAVDPPVMVLREAARHRILDRLCAPPLTTEPVIEPAPQQDDAEAPRAADRLLTELLRGPDPALITCWLQACRKHRRTVAAIHWTPLARLAARSTAYDRVALGAALGPRGRWFLRQNPEWRKLAADADADADAVADADRPPDRQPDPITEDKPIAASTAEEPGPLPAEDVLADPERLLSHPQPWGPELVSAAYAVLGGEGPVPPNRSFATRLGVALPTALYPSIARAGEYYVLAPDASPARRRTVRDRFVALELAAYARAAIDHAFNTDNSGSSDSDDSSSGFTRAEIPHV